MRAAGYRRQFVATAITFPCVDPATGVLLGPGRVRYADPIPIDDEGQPRKFNQPAGDGMQPPYIAFQALPDWPAVLRDVSTDLYIGEGELRALAFAAHGRYFISIGGVDAAFVKGTKRGKLVPWFDRIRWKRRRVFIVSDSDWFTNARVREAYTHFAQLLTALGAQVRIIKWRHIFKEKEGADDLIGLGLFNLIERWCETTPVWTEDKDASWPEPQPFYNTLPAVPRMTADMLPDALRDWIVDEAYRLNVPIEFIGVPAMFSLGLATMTRAMIFPKNKGDEWGVPAYFWFAFIASSGSKKTPAISIAMKPVQAIEKQIAERTAQQNKLHKLNRKLYESKTEEWEREAMALLKDGKSAPPPLGIPEVPKDPPKPKVLYTNSATVEALQEYLKDTDGGGVGYVRDELSGLLEEMEKPGRQGDRSFLIEGMEFKSYKSFRIGRGQTNVPKNAVALGGGIQPDRFNKMVLDGLNKGASNDGLLPRLSLTIYPDPTPEDEVAFVNRPPDKEAYSRALRLYERLHDLSYREPRIYRFDDKAQCLFAKFVVHAEHYKRTADLPEIVKSHFTKYDRMVASLAMMFKLCEVYGGEHIQTGDGIVETRHLRKALHWAWFLERHALRMYQARMSAARAAAQFLAEKIQRGKLKVVDGAFTLKNVYENDWAALSRPQDARDAVDILIAYDWVREAPSNVKRVGKPSERYELNPKVTSDFPEVNAEKVQFGAGNTEGKEGRGVVVREFWEEEEEKISALPSNSLSPRYSKNKGKSKGEKLPPKFARRSKDAEAHNAPTPGPQQKPARRGMMSLPSTTKSAPKD